MKLDMSKELTLGERAVNWAKVVAILAGAFASGLGASWLRGEPTAEQADKRVTITYEALANKINELTLETEKIKLVQSYEGLAKKVNNLESKLNEIIEGIKKFKAKKKLANLEKKIKNISPKSIPLSPAEMKALNDELKKIKAKSTLSQNQQLLPSTIQQLQQQVEDKKAD